VGGVAGSAHRDDRRASDEHHRSAQRRAKVVRRSVGATSGAANRPGKRAPNANPAALNATMAAAPTPGSHQIGPPQVACRAVARKTTATDAAYNNIAQAVTAAQAAS